MNITSLWQWLRDRYPQGALRSQFLGIHGDRFLVQVGLYGQGEDSTPFLTALGSGHSPEAAEDQGHQRLWAWLQETPRTATPSTTPWAQPISPSPVGDRHPATPARPPQDDNQAGRAIAPAPQPKVPTPSSSPAPRPPETAALGTPTPSNGHGGTAIALVNLEEPELTLLEFAPEPEFLAPPVAEPQHPIPPPEQPEPPVPAPPSPLQSGGITPDLAPPAPVDLSDIIAQTGIELRRLGWTDSQGREYLKTTYGKLSRHHLSDAELLEFLCYLESLPTP